MWLLQPALSNVQMFSKYLYNWEENEGSFLKVTTLSFSLSIHIAMLLYSRGLLF